MRRSSIIMTVAVSGLAFSQESMNFADWQELSEPERRDIARQWSPYGPSDIAPLLSEIVAAFRNAYPEFDIPGTGNVHNSLMLVVMRPFIFDKRAAPNQFMGLDVRYTLDQPVPEGFEIYEKYIWAPENYLNFVDNHAADIHEEFGDPNMTREDMLAALVGMPFDDWIDQCRQSGPDLTRMVPGQRVLSSKPWWKLW